MLEFLLLLLCLLARAAHGDLFDACPLGGILDPEVCMSVPELISQWGYPIESHDIPTTDGYILQVHRIPHGRGDANNCETRPVVFMQHGLLGTSADWVINKPDQSPGFLLADAGFDVWLGNVRGNPYGLRHRTLKATQSAFWNFSWDEMAGFDLPAMINTILAFTNQNSLYYFGHSQDPVGVKYALFLEGTLMLFAKMATDSTFASRISHFYAFAPIGSAKHIKGLLRTLGPTEPVGQFMFDTLGSNGIPSDASSRLFGGTLCSLPLSRLLCISAINSVSGPSSSENFNRSRVGVYFAHFAAGTSSQNMQHWAQTIHRGGLHHFDYGSEARNMEVYEQPTPPAYDYSQISSVSISLLWSEEDWLADPIDLREFLFPNLQPSVVKANISLAGYAHADFVYGLKAKNDIYRPIIEDLTDSVTKCPNA